MFRPHATTRMAAIFCLFGASCQALTGDVEVIPVPPEPASTPGPLSPDDAPPIQGADDRDPSLPGAGVPGNGVAEAPVADAPLDEGVPPAGDGVGSPSDEGEGEVDAGPPPPVARPVRVTGAAAELELVGGEGGQPHLGVCEGGVVIGVRPTANPSEEVFGQRVTLVEPICGTLMLEPGTPGDPASGRVRVVPDNEILMWPVTDVLQGPPPTEVPDPRLVWVAQPPTSCPEAAPVLVGLSGEYDPTAPDVSDTAAIRSVVIECAPLVVEPDGIGVTASALGRQLIARGDSFAADGAADYASSCPGGAVITQILVNAGFWLDGFVLGCSGLASPHLAGEPCTDGAECQSGACGSAATCEP
jgi:hypothetical protein